MVETFVDSDEDDRIGVDDGGAIEEGGIVIACSCLAFSADNQNEKIKRQIKIYRGWR